MTYGAGLGVPAPAAPTFAPSGVPSGGSPDATTIVPPGFTRTGAPPGWTTAAPSGHPRFDVAAPLDATVLHRGPGSPGSTTPAGPPNRGGGRTLMVVALVALVAIAVTGGLAGLGFMRLTSLGPFAPAGTSAAAPAPSSRPPVTATRVTATPGVSSRASATTPTGAATSSSPTAAPETLVTAAGSVPKQNPAVITVMSSAAGRPCLPGGASGWGTYPGGLCTTWQPSVGLTSGRALSKGSVVVACQANLGQPNPVYTAGPTNTWWLWARADDGTWDWFPETAIREGESAQPVNGVALCVG